MQAIFSKLSINQGPSNHVSNTDHRAPLRHFPRQPSVEAKALANDLQRLFNKTTDRISRSCTLTAIANSDFRARFFNNNDDISNRLKQIYDNIVTDPVSYQYIAKIVYLETKANSTTKDVFWGANNYYSPAKELCFAQGISINQIPSNTDAQKMLTELLQQQ